MLKSKIVQVWHPKHPGVRVFVRRGWFKRLVCNKSFKHWWERRASEREMQALKADVLDLALRFHGSYETHALFYGYTTRLDTRVFDPDSTNGRLMRRVCLDLLTDGDRLQEPNA